MNKYEQFQCRDKFFEWQRRNTWRTSLLFLASTLDCVRVYSSVVVCIDRQYRCHLLFVYFLKHNIIDEHSHGANVFVCLPLGNFNHSTAIETLLAHNYRLHWGTNWIIIHIYWTILTFKAIITIFFEQVLVFVQYFLKIMSHDTYKIEFNKASATSNLILLHFVLFHR